MTNEEQNERYWLEIKDDRVVVADAQSPLSVFTGPDRLLAATAELNRLNAVEVATDPGDGTWKPWTPVEFLSKELPAVARRQRIEGHLAEVREIEESLARVLAEDAASLKRAIALREKLEKELASPLSSTLPAQNADLVGQDTPLVRNGYGYPTEVRPYQVTARADLFKPGPF